MSALLLAELEHEAGLPAGWLNVARRSMRPTSATSSSRTSASRMITFTGSSGVGWDIRARAAQKKVTLELGNSTPVLVEADADVEDAAAQLAQTRLLLRRTELHLRPADLRAPRRPRRLPRARSSRRSRRSRSATPPSDDTDVGPVIDADAKERIAAWIAEAVDAGRDAPDRRRGRRAPAADRARRT